MKVCMTLDRLVFDCVNSPPCTVTVGCVMSKASVRPRISYDIIIQLVVEGGVLEFIELGKNKNYIVLRESRQYWFEVVVMYKTQVPRVNDMKKVQWEGIKLCVMV